MSRDWLNGESFECVVEFISIFLLTLKVQGDNRRKEGEAHCHVGLALENRGK